MSLLEPSRRWRPTETDIRVLAAGAGLGLAGFVVTWKTTASAVHVFLANGLLSVGVAIALVGVLLRVQLDLQEELDDAQQARARFEGDMRRDLAIIDRRVTEALARLPADDDTSRAQLATRTAELAHELRQARERVSDLEATLAATRQRARIVRGAGLLAPIRGLYQEGTKGPITDRAAATKRTARIARAIFRMACQTVAYTVGGTALWFVSLHVLPGGQYDLISTSSFRLMVGMVVTILVLALAWTMSSAKRGTLRLAVLLGYFFALTAGWVVIQLIFGRAPHG